MAGIGFALRKAQAGRGLVGAGIAGGHAVIVAAGPWLFAILAIGLISWIGRAFRGPDLIADFRVATIYAFSVSLVLTAPVAAVAMRLVADALFSRNYAEVGNYFIAALVIATAVNVPVAILIFVVAFDLEAGYATAAIVCSTSGGLVWVAAAFCATIRQYRRVTLSFLAGFGFSVVACVFMSARGSGATEMVCALAAGLSLTFMLLASAILRIFPGVGDWNRSARVILSRHHLLGLAGLAGAASVWIDKWVFWAERGEQAHFGLWHSPIYDGAMFIGCLAIIPALASFVMNFELVLFQNVRRYLGAVLSHRTLGVIETARRDLERNALRGLDDVILLQVGVSAVLVIAAPAIAALAGLQYAQIAILRMGFIGASFQFVFFASSAIVAFCDRRLAFLVLQLTFLTTNLGLTLLFMRLGSSFDGMGYLLASVSSGVFAYGTAVRVLADLNFLLFVRSSR